MFVCRGDLAGGEAPVFGIRRVLDGDRIEIGWTDSSGIRVRADDNQKTALMMAAKLSYRLPYPGQTDHRRHRDRRGGGGMSGHAGRMAAERSSGSAAGVARW